MPMVAITTIKEVDIIAIDKDFRKEAADDFSHSAYPLTAFLFLFCQRFHQFRVHPFYQGAGYLILG